LQISAAAGVPAAALRPPRLRQALYEPSISKRRCLCLRWRSPACCNGCSPRRDFGNKDNVRGVTARFAATALAFGLVRHHSKFWLQADPGRCRGCHFGAPAPQFVRTVSGEFLLSLQHLWRHRGDEILETVADKYPELIFTSMAKLSRVLKFEVGGAGDFAKLGSKEAILERLQEKGGAEARRLFETFIARRGEIAIAARTEGWLAAVAPAGSQKNAFSANSLAKICIRLTSPLDQR
jgi:hypothetical protein